MNQFKSFSGLFLTLSFSAASLTFFALFSQESTAAPCCARSSAAPFLILGDDELQYSFGVSSNRVVAETSNERRAYFLPDELVDQARTLRLDGATLLSDRAQVGVSLSAVNRSVRAYSEQHSSFQWGDTRLSLGYEFLTNWSYSSWRPTGYLFSVVTLPTGKSNFNSVLPNFADVSGNGFYSVSVGGIFLKRWNTVDGFFMTEVHYSFPRTFDGPTGQFQVIPGGGGSLGGGLGWSPGGGAFRLGMRVQPRVDQPRLIPSRDRVGVKKSWASSCDTGFDLSYLIGSNKTFMISYTDQTLLGIAQNSNLNRTVGLSFQHRWER